MSLAIAALAGFLLFCAIFFSYARIEKRIVEVFNKNLDDTDRIYKDLFIAKEKKQIQKEILLGNAALSLLLLGVLGLNPFGFATALLASVLTWKLPKMYLERVIQSQRVKAFTDQFVDALTLMSNGLRSGFNISQALQNVVDEMKGPVAQEFALVLSENRLGVRLEAAFENLSNRLPSEDVKMFVTSVNILRETGGNMAETFDIITETIRERIKLKNKIDAMTAQGRSSAMIVGALPWIMAGFMALMDPKVIVTLFTDPKGWIILGGVITLETIGFLVISKIIAIKV